ncbi:glycosyltransferase family 2 protein [Aureimonas fodinaquatilis]|uniref:Glycosyltransferase family 2 protein n=1 Tax=Aureimonas fodinaquatilis TaxID=2565783 RepID=A0A5B0DUM1_9HYPH|nr:glycosyltransferase [Aureimonas fodinaquatilis]KAA0969481.1 glycosyltransferase family 2 protein [Aureimonas fodinaquatilis]
MMDLAMFSWAYASQRTIVEMIGLFWFLLVFDIPRYFLGFICVFITSSTEQKNRDDRAWTGKVSVLIAGYNEAESVERCIRSLRGQSYPNLEIICVDDGSLDGMYSILHRLETEGVLDKAIRVNDRGGKSAALNLASSVASGEVFVVVDCDCTLDRDAVAQLTRAFVDPDVGAVSGAVLVRNTSQSIMSSLQAIEYIFSIHLGRALVDYFGLVTCVSGALGAFRRNAWAAAGGMDVGPGEDLDLTLKLRQRGFKIRFASDALCWTTVPASLKGFLLQRRRWERDAARLRFQKFGFTFNPFDRRFRLIEALHQVEFLLYCILAAVVFIAYAIWLSMNAPLLLPIVLIITTLLIILLDAVTLLLAAHTLKRYEYLGLLPFIPLFAPFQFVVMRNARLLAYLEELLFATSQNDNFVPLKVRKCHQARNQR